MTTRNCRIILESGDDLLQENGDFFLTEAVGGWLQLETGDYLLQESGDKFILESGAPCEDAIAVVTAMVFHVGRRRAVGHRSRGMRTRL
jgi:hypothetical protein